MGIIFKADKQPKLEEGYKMYGYEKIKKCVMKKEVGEETEECKKLWKDLGIREEE